MARNYKLEQGPTVISSELQQATVNAGRILRDDDAKQNIVSGTTTKDVPIELIDAVIKKESEWDPSAYNAGTCGPGNSHASGLGQFCMNLDSPTNPGGSSLEISDYQAITQDNVTMQDVIDPKKAMLYTAFGLGDRYSRWQEKTGGTQPSWYNAAIGYSPDPNNQAQVNDYIKDLKQNVTDDYGPKVANQLEQGTGGTTGQQTKTCSFFDFQCKADNAETLGTDIFSALLGKVVGPVEKFAIIALGGVIVLMGVMMLARKPAMQFVKEHPEVMALV